MFNLNNLRSRRPSVKCSRIFPDTPIFNRVYCPLFSFIQYITIPLWFNVSRSLFHSFCICSVFFLSPQPQNCVLNLASYFFPYSLIPEQLPIYLSDLSSSFPRKTHVPPHTCYISFFLYVSDFAVMFLHGVLQFLSLQIVVDTFLCHFEILSSFLVLFSSCFIFSFWVAIVSFFFSFFTWDHRRFSCFVPHPSSKLLITVQKSFKVTIYDFLTKLRRNAT